MTDTNEATENNETSIIAEVTELLRELQKDIGDEYRAYPDDEEPGMQVTIATSDGETWTYQTGDNSYTGSCYSHSAWGVMSLYRDSDCAEVAKAGVEEMLENLE